jgi:hypothetical protein
MSDVMTDLLPKVQTNYRATIPKGDDLMKVRLAVRELMRKHGPIGMVRLRFVPGFEQSVTGRALARVLSVHDCGFAFSVDVPRIEVEGVEGWAQFQTEMSVKT